MSGKETSTVARLAIWLIPIENEKCEDCEDYTEASNVEPPDRFAIVFLNQRTSNLNNDIQDCQNEDDVGSHAASLYSGVGTAILICRPFRLASHTQSKPGAV